MILSVTQKCVWVMKNKEKNSQAVAMLTWNRKRLKRSVKNSVATV